MKLSISKFTISLLTLGALSTSYAMPYSYHAYIDADAGVLYKTINFFGIHNSAFEDVGFNTDLGYQFNDYLGAEVGYTAYGLTHHLVNGIDLAAKFSLPIEIGCQDFNLFAKVGPSYLFANGDHAYTLFAGIGASYRISPDVDLSLQAQGITFGFASVGLLSAGLTYHFD